MYACGVAGRRFLDRSPAVRALDDIFGKDRFGNENGMHYQQFEMARTGSNN